MANTVIALKKSGTPSSVPTNLANGELAINYADGKLFYKAANGSIASISGNEPNYFGSVNASGTFVIADTPGDILTLEAGPNITIVGDAISDKITISSTATGGGITYIKKTSNYTANSGDGIIADTAAGTFNVTLPASPNVGSQVVIVDGNNWAANTLTVLRNGSTIEGINEDLVLDVAGTSVTFVYDGTTWETYFQLGVSNIDVANSVLSVAGLAFDKANNALANTSDISFNGSLFFPSGNVGIRTLSSAAPLSIAFDNTTEPTSGGGRLIQLENSNTSTSSKSSLVFYGADAGGTLRHGASILWGKSGPWSSNGNDYASYLAFYTRTSGSTQLERMRIDGSGNVLLNTTDTTLYNNTTTGYGVCYRVGASLDVLSTSDNALILNRVGTDGGIAEFRKAGTIVGSISVTGSSTAYNTSSDYRLKEDIKPVDNPCGRLLLLKPVNFAWKVDGSRVDGFIAHEAQEIVPEAVIGEKDALDDEGNPVYQGIDQSKLVPLLTAALQEALTKIDALEARIAALEAA